MPPAASGPVLTVSKPILSGAPCAIDGIGNAAAPAIAAVPARNLRRLTRMASGLLPLCPSAPYFQPATPSLLRADFLGFFCALWPGLLRQLEDSDFPSAGATSHSAAAAPTASLRRGMTSFAIS